MDLLIGCILPPIVEIVNKDIKTDEERFLVAVLTCLLVAVVTKLPDVLNGNVNGVFNIFLLFFVETMSVFHLYWKGSFLRDKLQEQLGSKE